jgi:hypothetical protein
MNIMIRDPYYLAKTVLGSYNLYILKDLSNLGIIRVLVHSILKMKL